MTDCKLVAKMGYRQYMKKAVKVSVDVYLLSEMRSHRLKAPLSSDNR